MRFKDGVNRNVKPETAYWMAKVEDRWLLWFDTDMIVTSMYRPGGGAHGRKEGWDARRPYNTSGVNREEWVKYTEGFCKHIQNEYGKYVGVQLEPEWGKGQKYTAPHIHFQLKGAALWPST